MEHGLGSGTSCDSKTQSATTSLELDLDEVNELRTGAISPNEQNKDAQLVSSMSTHENQLSNGMNSNNGLTIESPPTQVMDRASDSTFPDPDRIPPHAFSRTKSSAAVEWSVASNESLFSIHMGAMSFTKEQFNWMNKSGELGFASDIQFSGALIDIPGSLPPSPQPPALTGKSTEFGMKSGIINQGLGATEAAAAETMREVIRENAGNHNDQEGKSIPNVNPRAITPKHSDDSSIKSFVFPILTGDVETSGSFSVKEKKKKQHSQPQIPKIATAMEAEVSEAHSEAQASKPSTTKANKSAGPGRWFSYFSCCTFCS